MRDFIECRFSTIDTIANAVLVGLIAVGTAAIVVAEGFESVAA